MKRITLNSILFCAVLLFSGGCATSHHSAQWEYKMIYGRIRGASSSLPPLEKQLEDATKQGWIVVTATSEDGMPVIILKKHN